MAVEVTLLGTGSPIPDPNRAGPATLVRTADALLLVDCGRGTLMRLAAAGVMPPQLSGVLITHLHSDHITDLNDVITTHWVMSPLPSPLTIAGPPGTGQAVEALMEMLAADIRYRIEHHADLEQPPQVEVTEVGPEDQLQFGETVVTVQATEHRPVYPSVGYRVAHAGSAAAIAGDTVPCAGLDALCDGADLYVQTVIRDDLVRAIGVRRLQDILEYHSTVEQAAETAARNGVGVLVLTHYVPPMLPGQEEEWRARAAQRFSGEIVLGDDLTRASSG